MDSFIDLWTCEFILSFIHFGRRIFFGRPEGAKTNTPEFLVLGDLPFNRERKIGKYGKAMKYFIYWKRTGYLRV